MAVPLLFLLHKYVSACMLNFTPQAQEHTKYSISRDNTSKRSIALGVMFTLIAIGVSALPKAANGSRMESVTIEGAALASVLVTLIYYFYFRSNKIDVTAHADIPLSQTDVQRCKTYPHPYPNGWYKLFNSNEVMPGDVKLSKWFAIDFYHSLSLMIVQPWTKLCCVPRRN
jgi:heme/copper-type cytochrome/quinol oxidase subunit 4